MASLSAIHDKRNQFTDKLTAQFERELRTIVNKAQARVIGALQRKLKITGGRIDQTPANLRILRKLNDLFMAEMDKAGYGNLVQSFVGEFHGALPFLQDTLDYISDNIKTPLPALQFTATDLNVMSSFAQSVAVGLETAMEAAAATAMTRSMFSIGGLPFGKLVETLGNAYGGSIAKVRTLADTTVMGFYRTVADRQFQKIEADLPGHVITYRYYGPLDVITRPFCRRMIETDKAYTREEINKLDNGINGFDNVWMFGGGPNCRHTFELNVRDMKMAKAA